MTVSFEPGSVNNPLYETAFDGPNNPQASIVAVHSQPASFFLGPPEVTLNHPSTLRVHGAAVDSR